MPPETPRVWKIPNFITPAYQQSLLNNIRQAYQTIRKQRELSISGETALLINGGSIFNRNSANDSKRSILLSHDIDKYLPDVKRLYYHDMPSLVSDLIKTNVYPVDNNGTLALEILVYDRPGDVIQPHSDHVYFREDQKVVTALLCIENRSSQQLCISQNAEILSHQITQPLQGGADIQNRIIETFEKVTEEPLKCMDMNDRDLLVFEHDILSHAVRPEIHANESRIVIAMVFAQHPYSSTIQQYVYEKFKNIAHYPLQQALLPADRLILLLFFIVVIFILLFFLWFHYSST